MAIARLCDCLRGAPLSLSFEHFTPSDPLMRRAELTNCTHSIRNIRELPNAIYTALQFTPCFPGGESSPRRFKQRAPSEGFSLSERAGRDWRCLPTQPTCLVLGLGS
jgi:hypothetical protein